jgi:hypothetical protein
MPKSGRSALPDPRLGQVAILPYCSGRFQALLILMLISLGLVESQSHSTAQGNSKEVFGQLPDSGPYQSQSHRTAQGNSKEFQKTLVALEAVTRPCRNPSVLLRAILSP